MKHFFEPWTAHKGVLMNVIPNPGIPESRDIRFLGCFDRALYPKDYDELEKELGDEDPGDLEYELADRAAACVNALEGLNPAGVAGLITAAREAGRLFSNFPAGKHLDEDACRVALEEALKLLGKP